MLWVAQWCSGYHCCLTAIMSHSLATGCFLIHSVHALSSPIPHSLFPAVSHSLISSLSSLLLSSLHACFPLLIIFPGLPLLIPHHKISTYSSPQLHLCKWFGFGSFISYQFTYPPLCEVYLFLYSFLSLDTFQFVPIFNY